MIRLPKSLEAWGSPDFETVFKREIETLDKQQLPLQQGLTLSSQVTERPHQAMLISATEADGTLTVKAGIFYTGVIAGCNCADDPSPVDEQNEYCVVLLDIDKASAESTVTLLTEQPD